MHESIARMDHPNLVVVHYNQYAGGKFFINCLAHHEQVLPGLCVAPPVHTYDHWLFGPFTQEEKIQKKIDRINATIPSPEELHLWSGNELGCQQFWGWMFAEIFDPFIVRDNQATEVSLSLLNKYRCFIVNHVMDIDMYNRIKTLWPQARHVILHNESTFQQLAVGIKSPDYGPLKIKQLPQDLDAFYFDVDCTQFNKSLVIERTQQCLAWLDLTTDLNANIDNYISRYFAIHR